MHPPFIFTDHKIGPSSTPVPRPKIRRTRPEPLDLRIAATPGWPPMPLVEQRPFARIAAEPARHLYVVPEPRNAIRDALGRFLIRLGQRMILTNRPG